MYMFEKVSNCVIPAGSRAAYQCDAMFGSLLATTDSFNNGRPWDGSALITVRKHSALRSTLLASINQGSGTPTGAINGTRPRLVSLQEAPVIS